jgi:hypothetical protein
LHAFFVEKLSTEKMGGCLVHLFIKKGVLVKIELSLGGGIRAVCIAFKKGRALIRLLFCK